MTEKFSSQNRPKVQYRVELEKKIQINKSYSERRNQAIAMRILSYGLFGQKRYQNLYLSCSLNCFYYGLKIANAIHRRVAGLALIIRFQQAHVIEYYSEPFEGKTYGEKKYSKINIKLTKTPTEEDKNEPGYNPGLSVESIEQPLTDVIARRDRSDNNDRRGFRGRGAFRGRGGYNNRGGARPFRGGYRRPYGGYRGQAEEQGRQGRRQAPREGARDNRGDNRVNYRQFRSGNRYDQSENTNKDVNRGFDNRGERRTRGSYQRGGQTNSRYNNNDDDRAFDRRRPYQREERGEDRGERRPQRRYRGDSDQQK